MDHSTLLYRILEVTAVRMDAPPMYGAFHLVFAAVLTALAFAGAMSARRLGAKSLIRLFATCGWILAVLEIYKQLFLYCIVNDGVYDWWYFPFQLCSMPMYLCILLPAIVRTNDAPVSHARIRRSFASSAVLSFLSGFTLISAAAALIMPEDFLRTYLPLTIHGFVWHGLLLFISLTVIMSGLSDLSARSIAGSVMLFIVMCAAAVMINVAAEPSMAAAFPAGDIPHSYAAMFYLNPYHISPQPLVDEVQKSAGIPLGLALYVIAIILVSVLTDILIRHLRSSGYTSRRH